MVNSPLIRPYSFGWGTLDSHETSRCSTARHLDFPIDGIHWGSVVGAAAMHGRDFGARWLRSLRDEMMGDVITVAGCVEVGEMIQGKKGNLFFGFGLSGKGWNVFKVMN